MRSIKIKLMFLYITLVFVVVIICFTYVLITFKNQELEKIKNEISSYASRIDEQIIFEIKSPEKFQNTLENILYTSNNVQCSILNSLGETIASTVLPYEKYGGQSIIKSIIKNKTESFSYSKEKDTNKIITWLEYGRPSKFYGDKYIIFIKSNITYFFAHLFKMSVTMSFALVLALILAGIIGFLFASTLTTPIINLTAGTKEITNGNLEQKIIINSDDEIGELASNFNLMAKKLNDTMQKLTLENNKLEIILQNMTDGVIYFSQDGSILHYNYTAQNLFDFCLGKINLEFFKQKIDISHKSFYDKTSRIGDKYLNISFIPCNNSKNKNLIDGILVVIQDITKHKKLDEMRKEFVANVSHEIRTPLTTIKAYCETLLDGALEQKETAINFLSIINHETDRVSNLTKDLLELSRFDNDQIKLNFVSLDLCEAIRESINQNNILLMQKKQNIKFVKPNKDFIINADSNRVNQVLSNIISNAIKYSPNNTQIKIWVEESAKYLRVYVKDEGCGIPKEDLHRIFERFYRVDKARSREMGGTGLGLSIAKKIMEAHNGKISAISELNQGTTIIMRFNKFNNSKTIKTENKNGEQT